jgi:hypothetical protein
VEVTLPERALQSGGTMIEETQFLPNRANDSGLIRRWMCWQSVMLALVAVCAVAQAPPAKYVPPAPEQPIPYSHKKHLALGLECKNCHEMPEPGNDMGLPATDKCMTCHRAIKTDSPAIQKLAQFQKDSKVVPWVRIYHIPDYVDFSHKDHLTKAKATCEACHGPVRERDVMRKEVGVAMADCIECHRANSASTACDFCHDTR